VSSLWLRRVNYDGKRSLDQVNGLAMFGGRFYRATSDLGV